MLDSPNGRRLRLSHVFEGRERLQVSHPISELSVEVAPWPDVLDAVLGKLPTLAGPKKGVVLFFEGWILQNGLDSPVGFHIKPKKQRVPPKKTDPTHQALYCMTISSGPQMG